jgi:hypothetical protein
LEEGLKVEAGAVRLRGVGMKLAQMTPGAPMNPAENLLYLFDFH